MTRQLRRHERCLNCDRPVGDENFCAHCGQENSDYRVSLKRLLGDLTEELFQIESKLWRSLLMLFRRPGLLAEDYSAGRRVRWTSPLRLYLIANVLYFALLALVPMQVGVQLDDDDRRHMSASVESKPTAQQPLSRATLDRESFFERRMRHQLRIEPGGSQEVVRERAQQLFITNVPRTMALVLPLFAALTFVLFRRPRRFYVEHLVLSLHMHAVAFFLLSVGALWPRQGVSLAASLPVPLWLALALRRLFPQPWWRILLKLLVLAIFYLFLIGASMTLAMLI